MSWANPFQCASQPDASKAGHVNIGDDEGDLTGRAVNKSIASMPSLAAVRHDNMPLESLGDCVPDGLIVVRHEDQFAVPVGIIHARAAWLQGRSGFDSRKYTRKVVPRPTSVCNSIKPLWLTTMPRTVDKPQPGALALALGGEERRPRCVFNYLGRDPGTRVARPRARAMRPAWPRESQPTSAASSRRLDAKMRSVPPCGMASRALTQRLSSTW